MRIIHNLTALKMIDHVFIKSLDILLDKLKLKNINFKIIMNSMELLVFEKMVSDHIFLLLFIIN